MKRFFQIIIRTIKAPFRWLGGQFLKTPLGQLLGPDPEDTPITDTISKAVDSPMTFWEGLIEHLVDLRKGLIKSVAALMVTSVVAFTFIDDIMAWLALPLGEGGIGQLKAIEVTESIGSVMKVAFITGAAASLPYIAFQILVFIGPGISRKSRMIGLVGLPFVMLFFVCGAYFTYVILLPPALDFLSDAWGLQSEWRPQSYFNFITGLMFWIGICFEFPLISYILSSMGVLQPEMLKNQWRLATILLTILAAMITPTVDPLNMMLVFVPLMVLYGLSIIMAYVASGRRNRRLDEAEQAS